REEGNTCSRMSTDRVAIGTAKEPCRESLLHGSEYQLRPVASRRARAAEARRQQQHFIDQSVETT
ncbi:hypothetical protein CSUI_007583, partial [Cystoisospora suis]